MDKKQNLFKIFLKALGLSMLSIIFIPVIFFIPSMFLYYAYHDSLVKSILLLFGVCFLVGTLSVSYGIFLFTLIAPLVIVQHLMMMYKMKSKYTVICGGAIAFISMVMILYAFGIDGNSLLSEEGISNYLKNAEELFRNSGMDMANFESMKSTLIISFRNSVRLIPAIAVISSFALSYITYTRSAKMLLFGGKIISQPTSFVFFGVPLGFSFALLLAIVILDMAFPEMSNFSFNLKAIFAVMMFFQGISVLIFFMYRIKIGKFVQLISVLIIILFSWTQILFVAVGFFDSIFNIRGLPKNFYE